MLLRKTKILLLMAICFLLASCSNVYTKKENPSIEQPINSANTDVEEDIWLTAVIKVKRINGYVIDGNTYFFFMDENNNRYRALITTSNLLPFVEVGDELSIIYKEEDGLRQVRAIGIKNLDEWTAMGKLL